MIIDPVCQKELNGDIVPLSSRYRGVTYYFCDLSCKKQFIMNPERYCESMQMSSGVIAVPLHEDQRAVPL
ncbi:MAG: YHS domain-containing protein [Methanomicrobiales archaeon]|nr:YHS domain-containing protein [Methanomicrobiales archaeon]MDI6875477.1 YHS domain-containing protein [Methanomicrobiales archaeon]